MSSIVGKGARHLAWLCAVSLSLIGCHYSEENAWGDCCRLVIVKDGPAVPEGPKTMIAWQRRTSFSPVGKAIDFKVEIPLPETWKKQWIKADLALFRARNPDKPAAAYFLGLGMTCAAVSPKDAATRCEIELPIRIECLPRTTFDWWATPPKELREPLPAYLSMSIAVSADAVLDVSTRINPVPGGRLCHR